MYAADYRAAERTFQLLTQAAGRAGRGSLPGEVVIQTYSPRHYSVAAAKNQDYAAFYKEEIVNRKLLSYPPVSNLLLLLLTAKDEDAAERAACEAASFTDKIKPPELFVIGPADAVVGKVNDIYRKVIYFKHEDYECLVSLKDRLESFFNTYPDHQSITVSFDFNPMNGL